MKTSAALIVFIFTSLITPAPHAESLRCGSQLAHIGETKADIMEKCGDPVMTDSYCEPIDFGPFPPWPGQFAQAQLQITFK